MRVRDLEKNREYQKRWYEKNKANTKLFRDKRKKRRATWTAWLDKEYRSKGCADCPEKDISCLEFHHVNPKDKLFNITNKLIDVSQETLLEELAKCVVLCANCHRKRHKAFVAKR